MSPNGNVTLQPSRATPSSAGAIGGRLIRVAIHRSGIVRSVVASGPVQRPIKVGRALTVVRGRTRFVAQQLGGRRTARYELRECGLAVHLRPRTGDIAILNKIFAREAARSSYEPPAEIAAALGAARAPKILDVGANIGLFGVFALSRWPDAQITAYEPEPSNRRVLCQTVAANGLGRRWTVVGAAVSNTPGQLRFVPGLGAEAHIATTGEARTITVPTVDLFTQDGDGVDLIKMDIEGGEWAILTDPRLATLAARAIRLEWHVLHCPEPDARAAAIRLLRAGGFTQIVDADHEHDRNGVLWAWRELP